MTETGDRITRIYSNFRGADFRGEEINLSRSPDCLNVYKDYRETESIRTRPGMALKDSFSAPVYGIFFYNGTMLVHSGTNLYRVQNGSKTVLFSGLNERESNAFVYEGIFYFKDGKNYLQYNGTKMSEVVGHIPTTSIARKPLGGGKIHEDVNLLSNRRINTFLADGETLAYHLDTIELPNRWADLVVKVNGEVLSNDKYGLQAAAGIVVFKEAPPKPDTDGQDNVSIEFVARESDEREKILGCTMLQVFDNRVFASGNPDYPNTLWHCSLNDPTYWSDLDYYHEGLDSSPIRGLVAGNNALWVFREPSDANTTVFYHTPTVDSDYGKIYPSQHSSVTIGCIGKAINFNDDIVFFSNRGMEGISGDITTEQVAAHRSTLIDRKLISEADYAKMHLAEWDGYLLVIIGDKVYLADSRAVFTNENHIEYDWFYWRLEKAITCAKVNNGILYLGTADGVYTLTDANANVESYWVTPKDKFKAPQKQKTTNKRGCVVEATGDIEVYAKLEDTGFELIGTYENVTDYFACRIKRKKFKDIQLKFYSKTRFSLETATLECFVGGYIKR